MIKNIIFDLDGTLINTRQNDFNKLFFESVYKRFVEEGYNGKQICEIMMECISLMLKNDGKASNELVFINNLTSKTNIEKEKLEDIFNKFYCYDYGNLISCVDKINVSKTIIDILKEKGYNLILATNPLFPIIAIEKRAKWGNIDCDCFSYITSYENSSYCKPNINYYREIIDKNNLKIEETMMVGNDLIEDLIIEKLNVPCYIVTDNMVNESNLNNCTRKGNFNDLLELVDKLPKIKD